MALESYTGIWSFVLTNPTDGDPKYEGDNHLRGIKSAVNFTFPTIAAGTTPVSASAAELNQAIGVTSPIQTQLNAKGNVAGQTWTGPHSYTGATLTANTAAVSSNDNTVATTAYVTSKFLGSPSTAIASALAEFDQTKRRARFSLVNNL